MRSIEQQRSSAPVERRVSLWVAQTPDSHSAFITDRRMSLYRNQMSTDHPDTTTAPLSPGTEDHPSEEPPGPGAETPEAPEAPPSHKLSFDVVEQLKNYVEGDDPDTIVFHSSFHEQMYVIVESNLMQSFILIVIILNTLALCVQTSVLVNTRADWYLDLLDTVFTAIYLTELVVKLYVYRLKFFLSGWNILDFVVIVLILVDLILPMFTANLTMFSAVSIFRVFRVVKAFRALRLFKVLHSFRFFWTMQVILTTIRRSARALAITGLVMFYIIYLFSVIGKELYGHVDNRFESIPRTMFTLYLMLTLDDWYFIPLAIEDNGVNTSFYYLFIYIFVNVYIFINIYVAVICDNFETAWLEEKERIHQRKLQTTGSFANMKEELSDEDEDEEEADEKDKLLRKINTKKDDDDDDDDDNDDAYDKENVSHEKTIHEYYPELPDDQMDLLERCFLVASALENSAFRLMELHHILDMMVDVAADASDDAA